MKESTRRKYDEAMKTLGEAVIGTVFSMVLTSTISAVASKIKNRKNDTISGVKLVRAESVFKEED